MIGDTVVRQANTTRTSGNTPRLGFVDHPDLHKPARIRQILRDAEKRLDGTEPLRREDEMLLFRALHACGYLRQASARQRRRAGYWPRRLTELQNRIAGELANRNVGLVYQMLRQSGLGGTDEPERLSAGFWALFRAVYAFNPWRGFRFSTYACNAILRSLLRVGRQEARRRGVVNAMEDLEPHMPLDDPEPERSRTDFMADRLRRTLELNAADLTPTERYIIERRFLQPKSQRPDTLETIGAVIQRSKERVRQIQEEALGKLRESLKDDPALQSTDLPESSRN